MSYKSAINSTLTLRIKNEEKIYINKLYEYIIYSKYIKMLNYIIKFLELKRVDKINTILIRGKLKRYAFLCLHYKIIVLHGWPFLFLGHQFVIKWYFRRNRNRSDSSFLWRTLFRVILIHALGRFYFRHIFFRFFPEIE